MEQAVNTLKVLLIIVKAHKMGNEFPKEETPFMKFHGFYSIMVLPLAIDSGLSHDMNILIRV